MSPNQRPPQFVHHIPPLDIASIHPDQVLPNSGFVLADFLRSISPRVMSSNIDGANGERVMSLQWPSARRVDEPNTFRLKGLTLTDHRFLVPLDYTGGIPGTLTIFVREVLSAGAYEVRPSLPCLLYLQGGPGFESPRLSEAGEFVRKLARDHRLLLLDQRGTGLSSPVVTEALDGMSTTEKVAYLRCFRADSIVRDAELIRRSLLTAESKWGILGQSFGGFCCLTYLSYFPHFLEKVLICGGLAPVGAGCTALSVYRALAPRALKQMNKYYEHFPNDEKVLREIVLHIAQQRDSCVKLPSGSVLSVRGLQAIGFSVLGSPGGFARLHYLLERVWVKNRVSGERSLSYYFCKTVDDMLAFDTNPIYFVLHEAIYCNGGGEASAWAAERVVMKEYTEFDALKAAQEGGRVYLTGEMCFPFMLDEITALKPWKDVAMALANIDDWSCVYSEQNLRANNVPAAAVAYFNDMCVDFNLSMTTAGIVRNLNVFVTNEFTHSGLREGSDRVTDMLQSMIQGKTTLER